VEIKHEGAYFDREFDKEFLLKSYDNATIEHKSEITIPNHSFVLYLIDESENELDLEQSDLKIYQDIIKDVLSNLPCIDKKVLDYFNFSDQHNHHLAHVSINARKKEIFLVYWAEHYNSELDTVFVKENDKWVMSSANGKHV